MKTTLYSHDTALTIEYSQKGDEIEALIDGQALAARLLAREDRRRCWLMEDLCVYI
jgi:hypothetical protein